MKRGKQVRKSFVVGNEETVRAQEGTGTVHQSQVPPGWVCQIVADLQMHQENLIKSQFKTVLSRLDKVVTLLNSKGFSMGGNLHVAANDKIITTDLVNQENHPSPLGHVSSNGPLVAGISSEISPTLQPNPLTSTSKECSNNKQNEVSALKTLTNSQSAKQNVHQSRPVPHDAKIMSHPNETNCHPPCLNLPPAASPYVIVLAGVPMLKSDSPETFLELKNKLIFWLNRNRTLNGPVQGEILFARRVSWLGTRRKDIMGDCVVINFRDRGAVKHILEWGSGNSLGSKQSLPLGYFYPSDMMIHTRGPDHVFRETSLSRGPGNYQLIPGVYNGIYNIPVDNRFSPLEQVD